MKLSERKRMAICNSSHYKIKFQAAYSIPDLFNFNHKPFISLVLVNAIGLLTYAGHSHG